MADLYLRKMNHPQATNAFRVVLKDDGDEIEIGSISTQNLTAGEYTWKWGIDCVIPLREIQSEGRGIDRKDCMRHFRAAWDLHCATPGWLDEFLAAIRAARRRSHR